MNSDKEIKKSLVYSTKANDVDEKGVVTIAVNGIGIEDSQHDISMPGSFDETLKNDMARMRHFLNHDVTQLLGVPLSGEEKDGNLVMVSKLNLAKQIGRDTLADYKLYAEAGRTLEHSIGVKAIKRDKEDKRKVSQWQMFEFSTLTSWGANPQTFLVNIKSATEEQVKDACEFIRKAFKQRGYSDERLKNYDMELNLLLKSINGGLIVSCPHCGYQFDYESVKEETYSEEAIAKAMQYPQWMAAGKVAEQIFSLSPETRDSVIAILDSLKGDRAKATEATLASLKSFCRCPHCMGRVGKSDTILAQEDCKSQEADRKEEAPAMVEAPDFFKALNNSLNI